MNKENIKLYVGMLLLVLLIILFSIPTKKYHDCYDGYVRECKECHSINMSYSLCSGFCYEPEESDLNPQLCMTHPSESCEEDIPHNYCVVDTPERCFGLIKWGCHIFLS